MKLKFNNFNPEQSNTISNNNDIGLNSVEEYNNYAPPEPAYVEPIQPEIIQPEIPQVEIAQPQVSQPKISKPNTYEKEDLFRQAISSNYVNDTSITNNIVNDNTSVSENKVNKILDSKEIRQYARNDLKFKPILALFLNYFTIVLSFSIIGIMLLAFFNVNKTSLIICGIISILMYLLTIVVLPDFMKIFLDLRRNNTPSKMFSNKGKALSLFVVLFIKSIIFTLILMLFPVIGIYLTKIISNSIIKLLIYLILFIIPIVLVILIAIKYSLAELICVDGNGPIQSLKTSRKLLKNNTKRYIKSILPILGWSILASFIIGILCSLPMMMIGLHQGFNLIAGILVLFSILLVECIFMFPIYSYFFMIKAEFYDNAINKEMNVLQNRSIKAPIVLILSISLILILSSSLILYILPADISYSDLLNFNNPIGQKEEMVDTYALGLYFSIPDSYLVVDESDNDIYYAKDQKYTIHIEMMEGIEDFEEEIEAYNAVETTIGTMDGYQYEISNSDDSVTKYGFSFLYGGCKYSIIGDKEKDIIKIVESIEELGMMGFE